MDRSNPAPSAQSRQGQGVCPPYRQDDRRSERLYLAERLSSLVDALVQAFLKVRAGRAWGRQVVPELKRSTVML